MIEAAGRESRGFTLIELLVVMGNIDLRWGGQAVVSFFDGSASTRGEGELSVRFDQDEQTLKRNRRLWGNYDGELSFELP